MAVEHCAQQEHYNVVSLPCVCNSFNCSRRGRFAIVYAQEEVIGLL